ncbi:uncharacterized protein LOC110187349 isoform X1 [Drosophila serrata]|uniref:uncharacterized protein LOC110187349 isoform X1 n=1 Tax=Drosophila serrata TaxID=7274 RepID=UPI000A1D0CB8|nr:uncharacterized protein LOC110187349 isoform X1 [Drosophila serrata]XP_020812398.1 uncharacterized protein LOC110187349 isoform X1 [Drosophila serrata]
MPGVVFLIVVPTANFERELIYGTSNNALVEATAGAGVQSGHHHGHHAAVGAGGPGGGNNNLNINLPENNNAILRLEVELRDKNVPKYRRGPGGGGGRGGGPGLGRVGGGGGGIGAAFSPGSGPGAVAADTSTVVGPLDRRNLVVPLEKVLEELLVKLEIEHVTWTTSKKGYFHHVVFPLQAGAACETTLHCLTELGIGTKLNSSVSVLPCSVSYDAITDAANMRDDYSEEADDASKWNNFVESIKSKLTVKQVVDGVRAGGSLSFDYLLLIVTADSLAALGLVENNAPNIVAAMLVSPLMGPVMSITFGAIISDKELMRVGFLCLALGMFISLLFGFIFGLILGTTEMPWGQNSDWPTEEMRGRGNVRALWMGVLWALTSGTGVAVALLQGSAGPLIGVAISASLLPPVVNCGLFWSLACIWLIYPEKRIPHLKNEAMNSTSAYPFLYTNYLPTEFLINGIVSACLTIVNVICIFITAIIVLKIKEVSAPYTASPDLKRFWETDLRTVRKTNRSTMRHPRSRSSMAGGGAGGTIRGLDKLGGGYRGLDERDAQMDNALERALAQAENDATFKKVKRMSYSSNAAGELTERLAKIAGLNRLKTDGDPGQTTPGSLSGSRMNSIPNSQLNVDLKALDKLVSNLLEQHTSGSKTAASATETGTRTPPLQRMASKKLNRWRPLSRSAHSYKRGDSSDLIGGSFTQLLERVDPPATSTQHQPNMPTIMESSAGSPTPNNAQQQGAHPPAWSASLEATPGAVRNVLHAGDEGRSSS